MTENDARICALRSQVSRDGARLGEARALREGWYFSVLFPLGVIGCNGVIVNNQTGKLFHLGSAFPVERDLDAYDRGYQFESYDLVVSEVRDRRKTLRTLGALRLAVVEPTFEHGVEWRIPREMTRQELSARLDHLPCVFSAVSLYFNVEILEEARTAGWFAFEAREHDEANA